MSFGDTVRTNCTMPVKLVNKPLLKLSSACCSAALASEILAVMRSVNEGSVGAVSVAPVSPATAAAAALSR
ncbi:hypothetical protein GCM10023318_50050 [Nocardia callitridis]|uniref:Uncharacterized protein n=1 Tax=Nocardia callitridis TaxID=648753 RepID=A0ABP9KRB3_9NOCA